MVVDTRTILHSSFVGFSVRGILEGIEEGDSRGSELYVDISHNHHWSRFMSVRSACPLQVWTGMNWKNAHRWTRSRISEPGPECYLSPALAGRVKTGIVRKEDVAIALKIGNWKVSLFVKLAVD